MLKILIKKNEDLLDDSESENVCSYKTHNWIENQGDVKYCNQLTYSNEKLKCDYGLSWDYIMINGNL